MRQESEAEGGDWKTAGRARVWCGANLIGPIRLIGPIGESAETEVTCAAADGESAETIVMCAAADAESAGLRRPYS